MPGRDDRERRPGAGEHVDAALDHPVAAPREDQVGARLERALDLCGRLLALRDLGPERIGDAARLEHAAELEQPAAERLPRVRDDGDLAHGSSRAGAAATRGRAAADHDDATSAAMPIDGAAGHVERMVHAAVHPRQRDVDRDRDGDRPDRGARPRLVIREVRSRTRPPYTAIEAAVWPDG